MIHILPSSKIQPFFINVEGENKQVYLILYFLTGFFEHISIEPLFFINDYSISYLQEKAYKAKIFISIENFTKTRYMLRRTLIYAIKSRILI
ncbi:MAG: hypothetical protein RMJ67_01370 [Elusimicrobiota bacterium]|nr:hypothetical protein [Endomicrobiia bacterium]MDW8165154.1 hypothetical protein [Elusimicrobiota bacterium]